MRIVERQTDLCWSLNAIFDEHLSKLACVFVWKSRYKCCGHNTRTYMQKKLKRLPRPQKNRKACFDDIKECTRDCSAHEFIVLPMHYTALLHPHLARNGDFYIKLHILDFIYSTMIQLLRATPLAVMSPSSTIDKVCQVRYARHCMNDEGCTEYHEQIVLV